MGSSYARDGELRERGMRRRGYPQIRGVGFRRARVPRYRVGMARRRAVGAIGAITGLALFAACSGQPETPAPTSLPTQAVTPEPSTPPGGTPEPTPFPTDQLPERLSDLVTEPVLPDEASEFTTDGAAAFAHYIIDATNWAYATGDVAPLLDHCSEDSGYCTAVSAEVGALNDAGLARYGGLGELAISSADLFSAEVDALIYGAVSLSAFVDLAADGSLSESGDSTETDVIFHLGYIDAHWRLEALGRE